MKNDFSRTIPMKSALLVAREELGLSAAPAAKKSRFAASVGRNQTERDEAAAIPELHAIAEPGAIAFGSQKAVTPGYVSPCCNEN